MKRFVLINLFALVSLSCANNYQDHTHSHSSYAGQETRAIKSLSDQQISGYLNGEGMEMAKAGELNGYPGPKHVLDNAVQLGLTESQTSEMQRSFDRMKANAVEVGKQIVDGERELDAMFAGGKAEEKRLADLTGKIAQLQGELRGIHLRAHLEARSILSDEQVTKYRSLRGYQN